MMRYQWTTCGVVWSGWIEDGIQPGGFLSAVIENNLSKAVERGDYANRKALSDWVIWFFNYAPSGCFGSEKHYREWKGLKEVA